MQFASCVSGSSSHPTFSLSPSHRPKKTNIIPVRVLEHGVANHNTKPPAPHSFEHPSSVRPARAGPIRIGPRSIRRHFQPHDGVLSTNGGVFHGEEDWGWWGLGPTSASLVGGGNQSVDSPEKRSGASSLPLERTTPDAPPKHTVDVMREVMCFLLITPPLFL